MFRSRRSISGIEPLHLTHNFEPNFDEQVGKKMFFEVAYYVGNPVHI